MRDIRSFRPVFLREEMERRIDFKQSRHCIECDTELPEYVKYYCSGSCMQIAKDSGRYLSADNQSPT